MNAPFEQLLESFADQVAIRVVARLQDRLAAERSEVSPWMNIDSAAAYLDLAKARLYKLTAQGAIPHHKQDGRLLFHRQELDRWMAGFRQGSDWISGDKRATGMKVGG